MEIKFSVIIPAYNAENTIRRCLNSLLQTKRSDIEVLIIDDGSTDSTAEICRGIANNDKRVKYYKKENGGVSSARNMGLDYAVGEYICFVDSDDFVSDDYFNCLSSELIDDYDLLIYGIKIFDGQNYKFGKYFPYSFTDLDKVESFLCKELRKQRLNLVCNKVYKRALIKENGIVFPEQLHIGEDKVFMVRYITAVKNVKSINACIYISSTENQNSLSRKIRENLSESVLLEHELMIESVKQSIISERYKRLYFYAVGFSFYRSAYTVIGEIQKLKLSKLESREAKKKVCMEYKMNEEKYCFDLRTRFISLPIKMEFIKIIEYILEYRYLKKR
ncbi:MAG: glycosyltransferase [Ruminococcus sp.]|nr:glycosyltransferase [Ruminococcus sp.]